MYLLFWLAGGVVLVILALVFAPARAKILIDTPTSTARAEVGLFFGMGPVILSRALPRAEAGTPLAAFSDAARIAHALMTPSLADAAYNALRRLHELKPAVSRLELGINLGDNAQNRVVETAAQAALAVAPAALRDSVRLYRCENPGAELIGEFKLTAPPLKLGAIYNDFKNSRPAREFRRRLKSKPKPVKKPVREVRSA